MYKFNRKIVLFMFICVTILLCACGKKNMMDDIAFTCEKYIRDNVYSYMLEGNEIETKLIKFTFVKGIQNGDNSYEAYCEVDFTDQYLDRKLYYIFYLTKYDKVGWTVENVDKYEVDDIIIHELPTFITEEYGDFTDKTTYTDNTFQLETDYYKDDFLYEYIGTMEVYGKIREYSNNYISKENYYAEISEEPFFTTTFKVEYVNSIADGIWTGTDDDWTYYITIKNVDAGNVEWDVSRVYHYNYYYEEEFWDEEVNSGTTPFELEEDYNIGSKTKMCFNVYVGNPYHALPNGTVFSYNENEIQVEIDLRNIEFSNAKGYRKLPEDEEYSSQATIFLDLEKTDVGFENPNKPETVSYSDDGSGDEVYYGVTKKELIERFMNGPSVINVYDYYTFYFWDDEIIQYFDDRQRDDGRIEYSVSFVRDGCYYSLACWSKEESYRDYYAEYFPNDVCVWGDTIHSYLFDYEGLWIELYVNDCGTTLEDERQADIQYCEETGYWKYEYK